MERKAGRRDIKDAGKPRFNSVGVSVDTMGRLKSSRKEICLEKDNSHFPS